MFYVFVGYEFILYKCIASAQLNTKQNKEISNTNSNKPTENLLHKAYISIIMREKNSTISSNAKLNNNHLFNNSETSYSNLNENPFFKKEIENTPLRTLNIKSMKNSSPIFTKKDLLPELKDDINKIKNSSFDFIVIKSTI